MNSLFLKIFYILILGMPIYPDSEIRNLQTAMEIGISNSRISEKKNALDRLEKASYKEKIREYFPRVGISYYGLKNLNENREDSQYRDLRLQVQQLLYDGGETSHQLDIVKLSNHLSRLDLKSEIRKLEWKIQRQYFLALASRSKVHLYKQNLQRVQRILKETEFEWKAGFKPKIHVLEMNVFYRQSELALKKAEEEKRLAELELKNVLNCDDSLRINATENFLLDYYLVPPKDWNRDEILSMIEFSPEYSKSKLILDKSKKEKDHGEIRFKPRFYIGGYYGQNSPDNRPLRNESYGVHFSVVMPIGSSQFQSNAQAGIQADGTGIQRIPGFGPQYVGRGENSYNSSQLQLFDNFSDARKMIEGEISVLDSIERLKSKQKEILMEIYQSISRLKENHELIRLTNARLYYQWEMLKITKEKHKQGLVKNLDLLQSEYEFLKVTEELSNSILGYILSYLDFSYHSNSEINQEPLVYFQKNRGNSLFSEIQRNDKEFYEMYFGNLQ